MDEALLRSNASALCAPGSGLLASDESNGTIGKRLVKAGLQNDEETRRAYRELFYTADLGGSISGAIMYKETLSQSASDGRTFVACLSAQGILAGIKVDEGLTPLEGYPGQTTTRGLENLASNCDKYHKQGARFAKWRAALSLKDGCIPEAAIEKNAEQLAEYAAICQGKNIVPVVEPEILIDGTHDIRTFAEASERVISSCVAQLWRKNVLLEGCLFKPQMIIPGADFPGPKALPDEVGAHTLRVARRCVPPAIPGIMFLSGGQTEEECTINLNAINKLAKADSCAPWALSFSFGRALQASVLKLWSEDVSNTDSAKEMAAALARVNGQAAMGMFDVRGQHPSVLESSGTLREDFRGWSATDGKPQT
mmetsp:Transcript_23060/g.64048  ORF Transcript_23060/g.64048 Transcript_23060/m.64048 type:complete len:368 (-) Transcript_23060:131-1234(-)